jgi:hypothetical protein
MCLSFYMHISTENSGQSYSKPLPYFDTKEYTLYRDLNSIPFKKNQNGQLSRMVLESTSSLCVETVRFYSMHAAAVLHGIGTCSDARI